MAALLASHLAMNFCSNCGARVSLKVPEGDNRPRFVCTSCATVHYQNPRLVIGSIPEWDGKILLCRRGIEPRYGKWTLPAGFMENGETTTDAAIRETLEEAQCHVELLELFSMLSVPHVDQVHLFYRARMREPRYATTPESIEIDLFDESTIPWKEIAFRTVSTTLRYYFEDRATGHFRLHAGAIFPEK